MDLVQQFQKHWQKNFCHLSPANCQLLLAVSGGADSVVLVDLVDKSGFSYTMAHVNFQLRGEESERDEIFVRSLGEKYGKEVLVKKFDTKLYALANKLSIQEAARELRYHWFSEIIESKLQNPGDPDLTSVNHHLSSNLFTATAHHADDTIETMLMHFFRGTGIQGLTGIQPLLTERRLLRPLLCFRKTDLLEYAQAAGLNFVEDSSNASDKYTRNFFRNRLLPEIREVFPTVAENLLHNADRFREAAVLYQQAVQLHIGKLVEQKGAEWHIPVLKWKKINPLHTITWELIKPYGFTAAQTTEVIKLLDAENGSYISSLTYRIIRNRNWMIIAPNNDTTAQHILIEKEDTSIHFQNGSLLITHTSDLPGVTADCILKTVNAQQEAFIDLAAIQYPLLLRKAKTGDYFYPLGMQKKKKLSRFLIDLKLSKTDKEKVWVLESNQRILWVVGYRLDNRCKITGQTKNCLHITYLK
ncbi:MAG: tRNA lysidine(34) synthetase TilS [Sediminibacterium sp.]|nr:tRNA lysidine(34) synthetase TilS [Sediminibacterium sp.]